MNTRDALAGLASVASILDRGLHRQQVPATRKMLRELSAIDAAAAAPPGARLVIVRQELVAAASAGNGFGNLSVGIMRDAPWLLWHPDDPMIDQPGLLDELMTRAETRRSILRALIEAWLAVNANGVRRLQEVGSALRRLINGHSHPAFQAMADVDATYSLFDPLRGPRRIAGWLLQGDRPIGLMLEEIGFADPIRAASGYMRAVQNEILVLAVDELSGRDADEKLARLLAFLAPANSDPAGTGAMRFNEPTAKGLAARALLGPWISGKGSVEGNVRESVQSFLLTHLGDPRRGTASWTAAGDDAVFIMRRWLARGSMEAFFSVIDDQADEYQWSYRKAFWSAYLKAGAIDDAWVVLGKNAASSAATISGLKGSYGKLSGGTATHAALLMKIGDAVFCEWSHNGKMRAWPIMWSNAPKIGHAFYNPEELKTKGLPFPMSSSGRDGSGLIHGGAANGTWQSSASELIRQRSNIKLSQRDYMPR